MERGLDWSWKWKLGKNYYLLSYILCALRFNTHK
jgi:hypothetical protein